MRQFQILDSPDQLLNPTLSFFPCAGQNAAGNKRTLQKIMKLIHTNHQFRRIPGELIQQFQQTIKRMTVDQNHPGTLRSNLRKSLLQLQFSPAGKRTANPFRRPFQTAVPNRSAFGELVHCCYPARPEETERFRKRLIRLRLQIKKIRLIRSQNRNRQIRILLPERPGKRATGK